MVYRKNLGGMRGSFVRSWTPSRYLLSHARRGPLRKKKKKVPVVSNLLYSKGHAAGWSLHSSSTTTKGAYLFRAVLNWGSVRLLVYLLHILVLQVLSSNRNFNRSSQVITTVLPLNLVCNLGPYITQSLKQFLPWNRQVVQLGSMINLFHSLYYCWSCYWHIGSMSTFCLFGPFRPIFWCWQEQK